MIMILFNITIINHHVPHIKNDDHDDNHDDGDDDHDDQGLSSEEVGKEFVRVNF